MFFKAITAFNIDSVNQEPNDEEIKQGILERTFEECSKYEEEKSGFEYVIEKTEDTFIKASGAYILKVKQMKKDVPGAVLNEKLRKEVLRMEKERGEKVKSKEKTDLKESLRREMLSKAFVKTKYIDGYVDLKNKRIVVNTTNDKEADLFVGFVREIFDLDISTLDPDFIPKDKMTNWLENDNLPSNFSFGEECSLTEEAENSKISISGENLLDEDIVKHIKNGKKVSSISLVWYDRLRFTVNEKLKINKIKFSDLVNEQISEDIGESDDEYAKLTTSYYVMVEDFNEMLEELFK